MQAYADGPLCHGVILSLHSSHPSNDFLWGGEFRPGELLAGEADEGNVRSVHRLISFIVELSP
jgi:hypothetical protein